MDLVILTGLANEFEGWYNCLSENTEKYKTFPVLIIKEVKKNW